MTCEHKRTVAVYAKCNDLCHVVTWDDRESDGYVPAMIGIGKDGDYVDIDYCLDCGFILSDKFPIPQEDVDAAFGEA